MTVRCQHCGAVYETEVPAAAIKEIARCQECGVAALVVDDEEAPNEEQDGRSRD